MSPSSSSRAYPLQNGRQLRAANKPAAQLNSASCAAYVRGLGHAAPAPAVVVRTWPWLREQAMWAIGRVMHLVGCSVPACYSASWWHGTLDHGYLLWRARLYHFIAVASPIRCQHQLCVPLPYVRVCLVTPQYRTAGGRARGHAGMSCTVQAAVHSTTLSTLLWWLSSCYLTRARRRRWYTAALLLWRLGSWCGRHSVSMYSCKLSQSCVHVRILIRECGPRPTLVQQCRPASGSRLGWAKDMPWDGMEKASRDAPKHSPTAHDV